MVRPSPLACVQCRSQHVKCDGKTPSCTRCLDASLSCRYLPSRRGRGRRIRDGRWQGPGAASANPRPGDDDSAVSLGEGMITTPFSNISNSNTTMSKGHVLDTPGRQPQGLVPPPPAPSQPPDVPQNGSDSDTRLVRLFYENFHSAHPILVPAFDYDKRRYPKYLQQVVRFIGSHYMQQPQAFNTETLRESSAFQLSSSSARTPTMVQALLLYSIILCASGEAIAEAQMAFSQAVDIALELGIYRKEFPGMYSNGNELEAESLRRTWWELTIVEVYMAALQNKVSLRCGSVPYDVELPCEESAYSNNQLIPPPISLAVFSRRMFLDEDNDDGDGETPRSRYSSFSYRIEAACILARVLVLNSLGETHRDHLQAVENALISWTNHLPNDKIDIVDTYGVVDEMLFQAHTIIQYAAMLLHLPRSNLRPVLPVTGTIICPMTPSRLPPSLTRHLHDIKATEASKQLSNLLSMRTSAQRYSPFIICSLALCGLVQLATSRIHSPECSEHHRNRVVLVLGCLKVLQRNWPIAQQAYHHVRRAAADTFMTDMGPRCFQAPGGSSSSGNGNQPAAMKTSPASSRAPTQNAEWLDPVPAPGAIGPEIFSPGPLSAYIDPTCSDPSFLNNIFDLDLT